MSSRVLVFIYIFVSKEFYDFISEGRERPEWLSEYESELDSAIASLRDTVGNKL